MKRVSRRSSRGLHEDEDQMEIEDADCVIDLSISNDPLRIIYIFGDFCTELALEVHNSTLRMLDQDITKPIIYQINSPGGDLVRGCLPIVETIRMARGIVPVFTYTQGYAYSAASLILACGDVGKRFISPLSSVMLHDVQAYIGWMDISTDLSKNLSLIEGRAKMYLDTFIYEIGKVPNDEGSYDPPSELEARKLKRKLSAMFKKGDIYLNAQETAALGIADEVDLLMPHLDIFDEIELESEKEEEQEVEDDEEEEIEENE